jgi:hypothetical protein
MRNEHPAIPITEINGYVDESDNQADLQAFFTMSCLVFGNKSSRSTGLESTLAGAKE